MGGGCRYFKFVATFIVACLIFVPGTAFAANETEWELEGDVLELNADEQGACPGHRVTGGDGKIEVSGGKHTIVLDNCTVRGGLTSSGIDITDAADVTIELIGDNEFYGHAGHPAIWVDEGTSLTIEGSGSFKLADQPGGGSGGGQGGSGQTGGGSPEGALAATGDQTLVAAAGAVVLAGAALGSAWRLGARSSKRPGSHPWRTDPRPR